MDKYSYISNAHITYIDELYKSYQNSPESVDIEWQKFFEGFELAVARFGEDAGGTEEAVGTVATVASSGAAANELKVWQLIHAYRSRGHLKSNTNPVRKRKDRKALLDITDFGLTEADLNTEFQVGTELGIGKATLQKILNALKEVYEGTVGFEYMYIREPDVVDWFKRKSEQEALNFNPSIDEKRRILEKLNEAVVFENFLHTKYLGQKRFSLEGGETTIPALDAIINRATELGVEEVMIGMAHRGRLNVLANIMGKTYEQIFSEFEGTADPDLTFGDGDVKYHMGYSSDITTPNGKKVNLKLAPNPSHLEAVDPVVEGFLRAKADAQYNNDYDKVMPILIHGDAAVAGQGVVYEVAQMSHLAGYHTGGTIHFIINNQVGFTTDFEDARSSIYCTDIAKISDVPVLHVNGDNPEAVIFCVKLAVEFRQKWHRDIFVDMVCYRRHGHNESDEPKFTQPKLYGVIAKHPNPRDVYVKELIAKGVMNEERAKQIDKEFKQQLQDRLNDVKQNPLEYKPQKIEEEWHHLRKSTLKDFEKSPKTAISQDMVEQVATALTTIPKEFKPLKQIDKLLKDRKADFFDKKELNWADGELLAYGSLLAEGKIVRMSGQDVKRGTFSHRHAYLFDSKTNEPYSNLDHVKEGQEPFRIYNSLLSEYGVLGFEYGYAMATPNALILWEAQFGDFANGAQVMIDQFITSAENKWQRMNGLVMLLPHGYEGQGPEHSSARPERFLQMAAKENMIMTNITTPANLFHLLRRQITWEFRKPCVVFSPKSLLRHPKVVSPVVDFTSGAFQEVIGDNYVTNNSVKKVLLCSGKVYYDLLEEQQKRKAKDIAVVRIEQLYPFPEKQLQTIFKKYSNPTLVWVQEEPENMGAWTFMLRTFHKSFKQPLELVSRVASSSPATGFPKVHKQEQEEIVKKAFDL